MLNILIISTFCSAIIEQIMPDRYSLPAAGYRESLKTKEEQKRQREKETMASQTHRRERSLIERDLRKDQDAREKENHQKELEKRARTCDCNFVCPHDIDQMDSDLTFSIAYQDLNNIIHVQQYNAKS